MTEFLARLKQRKLVQWALAYVAGAWVLLQVLDLAVGSYHWPDSIMHLAFGIVALGFVVTLVLAWYHGERGVQRVTGAELLLIALVLAVGGGLLWHFARTPGRSASTAKAIASTSSPDAAQRNPGTAIPDSAAAAASSGLRVVSAQAAPIPAKSIAVLPFENLSTDKANAYFADGIQDEILTGLARIGDLKVISRTSTQQYASKPGNLSDIARQLGVANILEGSVQKEGNEVRINVQLIDARSDNHIWAQTYDRKLDDVFAVESEVAQKIAASLQAKITQDERTALTTKPTDNPAAYAAYMKGLAQLTHSTFDRSTVERSIDAFQQAVTLDPDFALAWAQLANQQVWMYWEGFDPTPARLATAKAALDRAVTLAPGAPQVELAHAWYLYYGAGDFAAALGAFRKAQAGLPNDAKAWAGAGYVERRLGKFDAAVADFERARRLDPNSVDPAINLAQTLVAQRRFSEAKIAIDNGLALDGKDATLLYLKLFVLWNTGDLDGVDRELAARHTDTASVLADRARQALYRRDYASASGLFGQAVAGAGDILMPSSFGGYIPAAIDWKLRWALSEQRRGSLTTAAEIYRKVEVQTRAALAAKPGNVHVEVALRMALGLACAGLDLRDEAAAEGRRAVALIPEAADAWEGTRWQQYLARIYALNGDATHAVPLIAHLLNTPSTNPITRAMLKLDPVWDPIRHDPRFKAVLKKMGLPYKPADTTPP